jgi:MSHA pilin protein MshD
VSRPGHICRPRTRPPALTLVEAIISVLIVSLMLTAALHTVGAARRAHARNADYARAALLAEALMSEILLRRYEEGGGIGTLGLDAGEADMPGRTGYDDVDDYHRLDDTPPRDRLGNPLPGYNGWSRTVNVRVVSGVSLLGIVLVDSGVKEITVDVMRDGGRLARLTALKTSQALRTFEE